MAKQQNAASGGWFDIRKKLSKVTERDLLALVGDLYQLSPKNRSFLESRFLPSEATLDKYKAAIRQHLCPAYFDMINMRPYFKIKAAKDVIAEYKKATGDAWGVLELMVYYAEVACAYAKKHGDLFNAYYSSVISVYKNALTYLQKQELSQALPYIERLQKLPALVRSIGWGFPDTMQKFFADSVENL